MATGDPYATLADLRDWQGVVVGLHTADDAKRIAALASATKEINRITGREFNLATSVSQRVFEPSEIRECDVDDFATTTGLIVETDPGGLGSFSITWTPADYELFPLNGLIDGEPWPYNMIRACGGLYFPKYTVSPYRRKAVVRLTAQWGWPAVPDPIHEACLILAAETYKMKDTAHGVGGLTQFGQATKLRPNGIDGKLKHYIKHPVLAG